MATQESKYSLLSRIMEIQKDRVAKPAENNFESNKQKAIEETKSLTIKGQTPESMFTKCSVMSGRQGIPKPLPGWSQEEANTCIPFLQRWRECMKTKTETIFIQGLGYEVPVKTIQSLNLRFLTFLSKFYSTEWDAVIVLIGTGSFLDQILLTNPDISHELEGGKILILNLDKDHSEFKEGKFDLYETLEADDNDFLVVMADRFGTEYCESKPNKLGGEHVWTMDCYANEDQYIRYVVAQTEWEDELSSYFLPNAKRTVLVDMTNRPAGFMPKRLASVYDAIYVKTNEPVDPDTLGTSLNKIAV